MHVADTYKSRTSKLWQFGPGLEGQNARRKLTDDGVAYVELMTGTFFQQPARITAGSLPHMVKDAKHYWYPLRDIEIAKNATKDAAYPADEGKRRGFYGVNVTGSMKMQR